MYNSLVVHAQIYAVHLQYRYQAYTYCGLRPSIALQSCFQTKSGLLRIMQMRTAKILAWMAAMVLSVLIIASHKHYTVDVTVAWYTVPLVFYTLERRWTTRRGDTKGDILDTQMKSLREVLVREADRSQQDSGGTMTTSEPSSTAGFTGVLMLFCCIVSSVP